MVLMMCGCADEPTPKETEKSAADIEQDEVKAKQLSIEEAAEQATKLIEEEAKAETDAAMPTSNND